jgi:hypothetical protein
MAMNKLKTSITLIIIFLIAFDSYSQTKDETVTWLNQRFIENSDINKVYININQDKNKK